jgi:hypothetical protein
MEVKLLCAKDRVGLMTFVPFGVRWCLATLQIVFSFATLYTRYPLQLQTLFKNVLNMPHTFGYEYFGNSLIVL